MLAIDRVELAGIPSLIIREEEVEKARSSSTTTAGPATRAALRTRISRWYSWRRWDFA
jgi:hypothetical protein